MDEQIDIVKKQIKDRKNLSTVYSNCIEIAKKGLTNYEDTANLHSLDVAKTHYKTASYICDFIFAEFDGIQHPTLKQDKRSQAYQTAIYHEITRLEKAYKQPVDELAKKLREHVELEKQPAPKTWDDIAEFYLQ
ncbi:MAG: hypothetical protein ACOCQX_01910 [Candidatus Nanoarchaeia archaeon]